MSLGPAMRRLRASGKLVAAVIAALLFATGPASADVLSDVDGSVKYMNELRGSDWLEGGTLADANRLDLAAVHLDSYLREVEATEQMIALARFYRGLATLMANWIRKERGKSIDTEALNRALSDFDHAIRFRRRNLTSGAELDSDVANQLLDAGYWAGHLSRSLLESDSDTARYFMICSGDGHEGCRNIIAYGFFTGDYGLTVNIPDSIGRHQISYDSDTNFRCAGGGSAIFLAQIAYYLPQYSTRFGWQTWLEKGIALELQAAANQGRLDYCGTSYSYLTAWLLHLADGRDDPEWLRKALELGDEESLLVRVRYFLGEAPRSEVDRAMAEKEESKDNCGMLHDLILHAKLRGRIDEMKRDLAALGRIDREDCMYTYAWMDVYGLDPRAP